MCVDLRKKGNLISLLGNDVMLRARVIGNNLSLSINNIIERKYYINKFISSPKKI